MFSLLKRQPTELTGSKLYDQDSFYAAFLKDLARCQHEVIIESPSITQPRLDTLLPTLEKLKGRDVKVTVNTRDPHENDEDNLRGASSIIKF